MRYLAVLIFLIVSFQPAIAECVSVDLAKSRIAKNLPGSQIVLASGEVAARYMRLFNSYPPPITASSARPADLCENFPDAKNCGDYRLRKRLPDRRVFCRAKTAQINPQQNHYRQDYQEDWESYLI